ncbi:FAD-dependent monooxygenase [Nocardia sp. CC201C]|uniref:FAD-dependent oxidoreductase n=1 Tax=Nocardia sp. CC201C TaxID=3044575 RepID=UPI0024A8DF12|nr:FAD-dependent monooxygenase [Nocardia sp. CC201C]
MVTIIGGGIAGTVLAGSLACHERTARVFERRTPGGDGSFLVLDRHAHDVLAELEVPSTALMAASYPVSGFRFHYLAPGRDQLNSRGHRLYRRPELMRALIEFARGSGADLHFDTPVTDVDPTSGTVRSGNHVVAIDDLVIAADGVDSVGRTRLEPERTPEYAGQVIFYGTTIGPVRLSTEPSVLHFDGRLGAGILPTSSFGHLWNDEAAFWFVRLTRPPIPQRETGFHPVSVWAEHIRAAAPNTDIIDQLLDHTETLHVSNARTVPFDTAKPPQPPLILCGDADHAITPAAGRGACEAIDDADALHRAILTGSDPAAAMVVRRRRIAAEREEAQRLYARARS